LPIAQAIGRLGNWFNQELFGGPTDLPWGLKIDEAHRPTEFMDVATFHPTFLYEGLWNLALAWFLMRVDARRVLKPGHLLGLWIFSYGLGRLWVEALRIDHASLIAGVRVNIWLSMIALAVGALITLKGRQKLGSGK
jgi:prolipoprotein diacylglyceryl transferase